MDKSLHRRYQDLLEIIQTLTANHDTEKVLDCLTGAATKLMGGAESSLILVDERTDKLFFRSVGGDSKDKLTDAPVPDDSIAGWVVKHGHSLLIPDVAADDRFNQGIDKISGVHTRSIIAVPMQLRGTIIGVLEVINSDRKFAGEELELLRAFASQAAIAVGNTRYYGRIRAENRRLQEELNDRYHIVTKATSMAEVLDMANTAAQSDTTILIAGESGCGKELVARMIHKASPRHDRAFVAINCASLSDQLMESALFGHEKGAFTGAHARQIGKLELADGGTFFFDEIGELQLPLQAKLLRVLQERSIERLGGNETIDIDVRLICATNRNLKQEVDAGNFREDLYYRLNVIPIHLPPLRKRKEEIPDLANFFLARYCNKTAQHIKQLSPDLMVRLMAYDWPGNVRELENLMERLTVLKRHDLLTAADLPIEMFGDAQTANGGAVVPAGGIKSYHEMLKDKRREIIQQALAVTDGNQAAAARMMEIQPSYLSKLIKDLGVTR